VHFIWDNLSHSLHSICLLSTIFSFCFSSHIFAVQLGLFTLSYLLVYIAQFISNLFHNLLFSAASSSASLSLACWKYSCYYMLLLHDCIYGHPWNNILSSLTRVLSSFVLSPFLFDTIYHLYIYYIHPFLIDTVSFLHWRFIFFSWILLSFRSDNSSSHHLKGLSSEIYSKGGQKWY
jgi:hypothetical protein